MGAEIHTEHFTAADHARFRQRLDHGLRALRRVLARPDFGVGPRTLGAELELYLIGADGRALAISDALVRAAGTPTITPEMGTFEIELSTAPGTLAGTPFAQLRRQLVSTVAHIRELAAAHGGRVVPISILPTLRSEDFHADAITDLPRYRALAHGLCAARGGLFEIGIDGLDKLHFQTYDAVPMEAANTAFQVHLSTRPDEFRDLFNAALLLSGPVIAAAANSPTFLGRRLWHETRVALFKQAGDDRPPALDPDVALPPRVNFGNGWVREGAFELFMESVALHAPLLAECSGEEDALEPAGSDLPSLAELRLHHGTVWSWNRPVYDPAHGGNLRIELRALPAGPSYDDMLANACLLVGAMLGLKARMPALVAGLPFPLAKRNFYLAAQHGLEAELSWPAETGGAPVVLPARELLLRLLPAARQGLAEAGVDAGESEHFLDIFEARVRSGQTGAVWQRAQLTRLHERGILGLDALALLLERYLEGFESEQPVHLWPLDRDAREVRDV